MLEKYPDTFGRSTSQNGRFWHINSVRTRPEQEQPERQFSVRHSDSHANGNDVTVPGRFGPDMDGGVSSTT
jgi:hypothetical protein